MKATGIVRRIEECVIIGQTAWKAHKHYGFRWFLSNPFCAKTKFQLNFYIFYGAEKSALFLILIFKDQCGKIFMPN